MPFSILHFLDHVIPSLPELPLLFHRPLLHLFHLHPLDHLLQHRVPVHQLVPPMTLRHDVSNCFGSSAYPSTQLTLIDGHLIARFPLNQVLEANNNTFLLLKKLLEGWRCKGGWRHRRTLPAQPPVPHPAQVLLGLAVQPHHALLPQAHPAHKAGEQPALVEEARRKHLLVLLEIHQVDDILPKC